MTERQWVYHVTDPLPAGADPRATLGGKGASLKEMSLAGLPVPPAFTITTDACAYFFEHGHKWPSELEGQVRVNLRRLEADMGCTFGAGAEPLLVSVRSGAAVSMPGMMDTILNCGLHPGLADTVGDTPRFWHMYVQFITMFAKTVADIQPDAFLDATGTEDDPEARTPDRRMAEECMRIYGEHTGRDMPTEPLDILHQCIDTVFRSWNNERAVAYRRRNGIHGLAGTGVNVQAMFPSHVSGILFTHDPTNLATGRMIVEASWGLGEAIVSGDVAPDRYVVSRDDFGQVDVHIGRKTHVVAALGDDRHCDPEARCLDDERLRELCELGLRVERHFGKPVDVEWGLADGRLALLQSRAIRGLDVAEDVELGREEEIDRLRSLAGESRRLWVIHNLDETLSCPRPLTWDIVSSFMSGAGGFGLMYRDFGYLPASDVVTDGFLDLICGHVYADPQRLSRLFWGDMPLAYDLDEVQADKRLLDRAPTRFDPDAVEPSFLLRLPRTLAAMLRCSRRMKRARRNAKAEFEQSVLPPYLEYVRAKHAEDLTQVSTDGLIQELHARRRRVLDDFGKESLKPGFFGGLAMGRLTGLLTQLMGTERGTALAGTLTSALEGDITFEQDALLYAVAQGQATMEDFLERFGHRAAGEMKLAEPRWREAPSQLEMLTAQMSRSRGRAPADIHAENVERRRKAEQELPDELVRWGGSSLLERIESDLAEARELLPYREGGKFYLMMGYELIRLAILELGRRWDLHDDVFYLHLQELSGFPHRREELIEEIAGRKVRWKSQQRLVLPDVIDSVDLEGLGLAPEYESAEHLNGESVAPGLVRGPVRIVFNPREATDLGVGYVLVCPSTDPGWTPLFMNAGGLVVERGGTLSHGAIVARDFGIPAVVCPNATRILQDGVQVLVDGNNGRISVLEED